MRFKGQKYDQGIVYQRSIEGSAFQEIAKAEVDEMGFVTPSIISGMKAVIVTSSIEKGAPVKVDTLPDPNCEYEGRIYIMDDKYYICLKSETSDNYYWVEMAQVTDVPEEVTDLNGLVEALEADGAVALLNDMSYNGSLTIEHNTTLDLNNRSIQSVNNSALAANNGGELTVNGPGEVKAQEVGVLAMRGSKATINGGTFETVDNFVFGTNGTNGVGGNTIIINDGEFNANITTANYIACGVYSANNDTIILNGGTFNIKNGIGVLARSGNVTIGPDVVFNVSDVTMDGGWVGDSKLKVPTAAPIILDLAANYPGGTPTVINNSSYPMITMVKALPEASADYAEQVFYNTEEDKYYICKEDAGNYAWEETTPN